MVISKNKREVTSIQIWNHQWCQWDILCIPICLQIHTCLLLLNLSTPITTICINNLTTNLKKATRLLKIIIANHLHQEIIIFMIYLKMSWKGLRIKKSLRKVKKEGKKIFWANCLEMRLIYLNKRRINYQKMKNSTKRKIGSLPGQDFWHGKINKRFK